MARRMKGGECDGPNVKGRLVGWGLGDLVAILPANYWASWEFLEKVFVAPSVVAMAEIN